MEPIVVTVEAGTQQAFQDFQAFQEALEGVGNAGSAAIDRIDKRIFELTRSQQTLSSAVGESAQRIEEYSQKRAAASEAEQAGIDAAIAKEKQLTAAHERTMSVLESKIEILNGQKEAATASGEQEKLAIQLTVQERLIELQAIRDTTAAIIASDKASEASAVRTQAALDAQAAKQAAISSEIQTSLNETTAAQERHRAAIEANNTRIAEYRSMYAQASETEQAGLDAAIAKEQTLADAHQFEIAKLEEKATVTQGALEQSLAQTEQHKAAIAEVVQARLTGIAVAKDEATAVVAGEKAAQSAEEKQLASLEAEGVARVKNREQFDAMTSSQRTHLQVIEADRAQIAELEAQKSTASTRDKDRIEQEVNGLRKVITAREQEVLTIEMKKVKLQESYDKSLASSDAEREAAEASAQARLVEIGTVRDLEKAQAGVNETVAEGTNVGDKFLSKMLSLGSVILVAQQITQAFKELGEQVEKDIEAAQHLRDLSGQQASTLESVYQAFNVTDQEGEKKLNNAVLNTMKATGVEETKVAETYSTYAQFLTHAGIAPDSEQGKGILNTGALYDKAGISPQASGYVLQDQLKQNPQLSGDQLNQKLADYRKNFNSNQQFEQVLDTIRDNGDKFYASGINTDEVMEIASTMANRKDVNPAAYQRLMRQMSQSLTRNAGKTPAEMLEDFEAFGTYSEGAKEQLKAAKYLPLDKQLDLANKLVTPGTGAPTLYYEYHNAIANNKPLNVANVFRETMGIHAAERDIVNRRIAGPRDTEAGYWFDNWTSMNTADAGTGTPLQPIQSGTRTQQTEKDIANLTTAMGNVPDPGGTSFNTATGNAGSVYDSHLNDLPDRYKGASGYATQALTGVVTGGVGWSGKDERDAATAYGLKFMELVRLREAIDTGKMKVQPGTRQRIQGVILQLLDRLEVNVDKASPEDAAAFAQYEALARGSAKDEGGNTLTKDGVLGGISDDSAFVVGSMPYNFIGSYGRQIADPTVGASIFGAADSASRAAENDAHKAAGLAPAGPPTPVPTAPTPVTPTTRPSSPVSVNYHQRINNYGTAFDSIGAPNSFDGRYS